MWVEYCECGDRLKFWIKGSTLATFVDNIWSRLKSPSVKILCCVGSSLINKIKSSMKVSREPGIWYRVDLAVKPKIIPLLSACKNHSINLLILSFMRYTWFKSPMIYKALPIFDHSHPIIISVTFSVHKSVSACKRYRFLEMHQILESQNLKGHAYFWPPPFKIHWLSSFLNLYQDTKNQFIPLILPWDTADLKVLRPE